MLFREMLQHEHFSFQWRQVFRSLRLMELSGEVYSGYFFSGIPGPQFISPGALRFLQGHFPSNQKSDAVFWINAQDPVSTCGIPFEGLRTVLPRRVMSNHLTYHDKDLVLVSKRNGRSLNILVSPDHPDISRYFICLKHLLYRSFLPLNKITIESINDEPARQSPYFEVLGNCFDVVSDYKAIYLQRRI
jgi:ATP-dependent Lhr-like helicase